MANPKKSPADRKRKPIFTEVSEETVPNSTPNQILKLRQKDSTIIFAAGKCSNNTNQTWTDANRVTIIFPYKYNSIKHLLPLFYKNILKICKRQETRTNLILNYLISK